MDRVELPGVLSGGYIEDYELDLRGNLLTMRVDVLDGESFLSYNCRFERVSWFEFTTESRSDAGSRLELTELWIDAGPESSGTEEWSVTINIWDRTYLRLRCSIVRIDGEMLV